MSESAVFEKRVIKVRAATPVKGLAGALVIELERHGEAELQGMGPSAVNQMVKAAIVARGLLVPGGEDLHLAPAFVPADTADGEERTAIRILVRKTPAR